MDKKMSPRMRVYYSLIVVIIILFSGAMVTGVLFLCDALGVNYQLSFPTLISIFVVAAVAGGMVSIFIGRRVLAPMVKLSNASTQVARGDFTVTVSDSSKLQEVQTTFRNFNAMVRELGIHRQTIPVEKEGPIHEDIDRIR